MRIAALTLYSCRVGSVGSFRIAAVDREQAQAIAEQWRADREVSGSIRITRDSDSRYVFTAEV